MKTNLSVLPTFSAIALALVLSSCGKQEAVGDVPSSEQLAKEADAATAAIREEAAEAENSDGDEKPASEALTLTSYNNALRGYAIMVPESWVADETAGDDNGQVFKAAENGGELSVSWTENRDNADYTESIDAIEKLGDAMSGEKISEDEYRASSADGEDQKTMVRIVRKADGSMVRAQIEYPSQSAAQLDTIAKQIVDSLALK